MKNLKIKILFLLLVFICGCVPAVNGKKSLKQEEKQGIPKWVYSPPSMPGYLYGVGISEIYSTPAEALVRARELSRVELVKQLKVKVYGETSAGVKREIEQGKSKITRTVFNYAESSIEETELPGIKIIETAVSKKERQVFALAELNRSEAEMDLSSSLESIDKRIKQIISGVPAQSKIKEIKRMIPALKLIEKRKKIVSDLKLVGTIDDPAYETADQIKAAEKTAGLMDSLVFVVKWKSEKDRKLASGIIKALSDEGVKVRTSGNGDLYVNFSASLDTVKRKGVYYTFAGGQATVRDNAENIISEFSSNVKSGSADEKLSEKRAVEKLAKKLGNSIAKGIFESN